MFIALTTCIYITYFIPVDGGNIKSKLKVLKNELTLTHCLGSIVTTLCLTAFDYKFSFYLIDIHNSHFKPIPSSSLQITNNKTNSCIIVNKQPILIIHP